MSKEVLFKISNNDLYLDFMLEEHDFIPIFYVCKDNIGGRYVVLCSNFEQEEYLISRISLSDLQGMLSGSIDIRSAFLGQPIFWHVFCKGETYLDDIVKEHRVEEFPMEFLPAVGTRYELFDDEHREYSKQISAEYQKMIADIKVFDIKTPVIEGVDNCLIEAEYYDITAEIDIKLDFIGKLLYEYCSNNTLGLFAA